MEAWTVRSEILVILQHCGGNLGIHIPSVSSKFSIFRQIIRGMLTHCLKESKGRNMGWKAGETPFDEKEASSEDSSEAWVYHLKGGKELGSPHGQTGSFQGTRMQLHVGAGPWQ